MKQPCPLQCVTGSGGEHYNDDNPGCFVGAFTRSSEHSRSVEHCAIAAHQTQRFARARLSHLPAVRMVPLPNKLSDCHTPMTLHDISMCI